MSSTTLEGNGKPSEEASPPKKAARLLHAFPQHRLEDAIRVVEAIENANAGQPYPPAEVAIALNRSPGSTAFHSMLSSSYKYGLTTGSYKSEKIVVTSLGQRLTTPTSEEERPQAVVEAVLAPPTFQRAYEYYKGKKLPETTYLMNTLVREFDIPTEHAEHCAEIFRANLHFAGLLRQATTGLWVSAEVATGVPSPTSDEVELDDEENGLLGAEAPEELTDSPVTPPVAPADPPERPKAIFVGHGPDKTALEQLTKILVEWGLPHKVAEYEPNAGRPVSKKVADLMDECGAAILIFTADRELRDLDGESIWLSSSNVAHELGAASVLYEGRVVVFKEGGVDLASNYSGIGYIEFEKGKLSAHAMELFREVQHFGLIKITVGG